MTFPIVRFVSAPDVDADVRFDFNTAGEWSDDETWPEHDGFSLGAPALEGDPDAYGVQYGLRQLEFNVVISGAYSDASRQWSRLARELTGRRTNWLMFQFSEFSQPVWFKTYRTAPEALDFEQVDDTDDASSNLWGLGVQLAAEPFAYGERVTLPALTVKNDPAVANGCMVVLPEILGDAPAPARFEMVSNVRHDIPSPMFSVTPVVDSFAAPLVFQFGIGDAITPGTDMGAAVAEPLHSGGSYRPVTFASNAGMARRATVPITGITPGRYAVLLRATRTGNGAVMSYQAVVNGRVPGQVVSVDRPTAPNYRQWVDLGTFAFPTGLADYDAPSMSATSIDVYAQRIGSGDLYLDAIVLMPVEQFEGEPGMRLTTLPEFLDAPPFVARWDGDDEYFQPYSNGAALSATPAILSGQFPVLTPGRRNVLHLFRQTQSAALEDGIAGDVRTTKDNTDKISMTTTVTISYHPRHLWLAG